MNRIPAIGTFTLLFVCAVVFVAFELNVQNGLHQIEAGATVPLLISSGEYWRILTANFVHFGLLHMALNGYFLYRLGPYLELEIGTERFLLLFLFAGLFSSCFSGLVMPYYQAGAGASGGLFGILGAFVAIGIRRGNGVVDFASSPAGKSILGMILINLMIGFMIPMVSNSAHIGGLFGGFLLTMFWFKFPSPGRGMRRGNVPAGIALLLLLAALISLLICPFHERWYQAREYWFADDERAVVLGDAMQARGYSEATVDLLATFRDLHLRALQGNVLIEDLPTFQVNDESLEAMWEMGIDLEPIREFLKAVRNGDPSAKFPQDPWRRLLYNRRL